MRHRQIPILKESAGRNMAQPRSRALFVLPVAVVLLFLFVPVFPQSVQENTTTFSQFRPRREIPGEVFVGSDACFDCHVSKTRTYAHTSMAHALQNPEKAAVLQSHAQMAFRSGPYSYEIKTEGQQSFFRVTDGKQTYSEPILYAFGNAHIAQTYVFQHNGRLQEGRVSYYRGIDGIDWTIGDALNPPPSLEEAAGRDIDGDEARNCFSCHGTAATVGNKLQLVRVIPGVSCEACHGPGGKHVDVMGSGGETQDLYIFNPNALDPETLSQEFCGACHRGVDTVAMMPDLGGINNVRFQPYRLFNSRGHDPRDPRFSCLSCHDPHVELRAADALSDSRCLECHLPGSAINGIAENGGNGPASMRANPSSAGKPCPVAKDRCVSCHMPKVELPGAHFRFTDHRIRIVRPGEPYPY
jgi:hypothetical protein